MHYEHFTDITTIHITASRNYFPKGDSLHWKPNHNHKSKVKSTERSSISSQVEDANYLLDNGDILYECSFPKKWNEAFNAAHISASSQEMVAQNYLLSTKLKVFSSLSSSFTKQITQVEPFLYLSIFILGFVFLKVLKWLHVSFCTKRVMNDGNASEWGLQKFRSLILIFNNNSLFQWYSHSTFSH